MTTAVAPAASVPEDAEDKAIAEIARAHGVPEDDLREVGDAFR